MINVSSLFAIYAYQRFHRKAPLPESGGNRCHDTLYLTYIQSTIHSTITLTIPTSQWTRNTMGTLVKYIWPISSLFLLYGTLGLFSMGLGILFSTSQRYLQCLNLAVNIQLHLPLVISKPLLFFKKCINWENYSLKISVISLV